MKNYLLDSNPLLRFLLNDNASQTREVGKLIELAKSGKLKLIIIPSVLFEVSHVLLRVYKLPAKITQSMITSILQVSYFHIKERITLLMAVRLWQESSISFHDAYLATYSKQNGMDLFTFDKKLDAVRNKLV